MAELIFQPDKKPLVKGGYGRNLRGTLYYYGGLDPVLGIRIAFEWRGCLIYRDKSTQELRFRFPTFTMYKTRQMEMLFTNPETATLVASAIAASDYDKHIGRPDIWTENEGAQEIAGVASIPVTVTGVAPFDLPDKWEEAA